MVAPFVMCGLNQVKRDEVECMKALVEHNELKCVVCGKLEKKQPGGTYEYHCSVLQYWGVSSKY
jgi:hypothetical protein